MKKKRGEVEFYANLFHAWISSLFIFSWDNDDDLNNNNNNVWAIGAAATEVIFFKATRDGKL
jgi:hypothetical protein